MNLTEKKISEKCIDYRLSWIYGKVLEQQYTVWDQFASKYNMLSENVSSTTSQFIS